MLKFLQEDEIYINAAKIIEIFGWNDCQRTSKIFFQIVKFPWEKIRLGKKFNFDLIAYFIQILDSESMCSSSVRFVPYRLNMYKKALI